MAVFPQYVYRSCHCFYLFRFAYPAYGGKTEREYFPAIIRTSFPFAQYTSIHCCRHFYRNATICGSRNERRCGLYRTDFQIDFNISLLIFTLVIAAYVIAGGMKGVMYTDALQAVIMFGCMLFLLFSLYQVLDMNFTEANKELTAIAPLVPENSRHWDIKGGRQCQ